MEITKSLRKLLESIPGVSSIFLTDRDGVIVLSVGEELRSRASLISSLQATQDQTGKLVMENYGFAFFPKRIENFDILGAHHASAFFYENSQLIILNVPPLTAFVVASPTANTGMLLKLREQLTPLVQEVEGVVPEIPSCKLIFF
ncbi:unnamed protein product [Cylicostephanus goldi]|uniref:Roadblock/LAMTOR2 domain-containing protein n=1 Tax=Cylicostephanus goldi TaxID=71465 RepID=A0A3P6R9F1_CYLGO|nr:unnamed protein product [Cylicostephanus goldi]